MDLYMLSLSLFLSSLFFNWSIFDYSVMFQQSDLVIHHISRRRNGTPLQYSYLENPMDGGAW